MPARYSMQDDKRLERIELKLDDTADHLGNIDVTLKGQAVQLEDHIRRTNELQDIVISINRKVTLAEGAMKFIGVVAIIAEAVRLFVK
jgi:hypothetical protein